MDLQIGAYCVLTLGMLSCGIVPLGEHNFAPFLIGNIIVDHPLVAVPEDELQLVGSVRDNTS